jgi:hypothetical protein
MFINNKIVAIIIIDTMLSYLTYFDNGPRKWKLKLKFVKKQT